MYCSGVAVVVCLKWIVDMGAPFLGRELRFSGQRRRFSVRSRP
jgi:hypothetical protein